jgi:3-oxoacyl-[acyl-carrier-protein] synthase II
MRRVVVTGIGIISPLGIGAKTHWNNLLSGKIGVQRITAFDPSGFPSQIAGEAPQFKVNDFIPKSYRKAAKVMARDIELAVVAADDAFKDAGLQSKAYTETSTLEVNRFGCNIGAGLINCDLNELTAAMYTARDGNKLDLHKWGRDGMQQLTPLWLLKYLPNMLACHVTIIHGLMGPSNTITCADASSHLAIGEAFRTIQRGHADLAICGGAESKVNQMGLARQTLLGRLNDGDNASPQTAVRPFDETAAGTAIGEGGGLLVLEEYEHAKARGAKIYAELAGFGASQDVYKVTTPNPDGHSYGMAIKKALADAKVSTDRVDCMVPCGLGIASHDKAELAGLRFACGDDLQKIPLAPIKGQIGNLAAGCGVEPATAVLAMVNNTIPAAVNTRKLPAGVKLNVRTEPRDAKVDVAVTTVYSLGGQNAALVFKRV